MATSEFNFPPLPFFFVTLPLAFWLDVTDAWPRVKDEGFEWQHDQRVLTIFSASSYCGTQDNKGAVAIYNGATGPLPPALPVVTSYYAVVPTGSHEACFEMTVQMIKSDFFMHRTALIREFSRIDRAGKGVVSIEDFARVLRAVIPVPLPWEHLWPYFTDADELGMINFSEFLHSYRPQISGEFLGKWVEDVASRVCAKMLEMFGDIHKSFRGIDVDGSREISFDEFSAGLKRFDLGLTEENIFDLFESIDTTHNGRIDFSEFSDAFSKMMKRAQVTASFPKEWCAKQVQRIAENLAKAHGSLEAAFAALDSNKSGKLSDLEVVKGAAGVGLTYTKSEAAAIIVHSNAAISSSAVTHVSLKAFKQALEDSHAPEMPADRTTSAFYSSLLASITRSFAAHAVQLRRFFKQMDVDATGSLVSHISVSIPSHFPHRIFLAESPRVPRRHEDHERDPRAQADRRADRAPLHDDRSRFQWHDFL